MQQRQKRYEDERLNKADAELRAYSRLNKDIERFREHEAELRERLTAPRCGLSGGVGGGTNVNANEEQIVFLADYSRKVDLLCIKAENKYIEIYSKLMNVREPYQTVLMNYYVDGWGLEKISQKMCYSFRQVLRLKKEGLEEYIKN